MIPMYMENIKKLLQFVKLINDLGKVGRDIPQSFSLKKENDLEYSYQLAMVSRYLVTAEGKDLDIEKILKYSFIHDLPKTYAGDTPFYASDNDYLNSKKEREINSIERIRKEFLSFADLHKWIEKYER